MNDRMTDLDGHFLRLALRATNMEDYLSARRKMYSLGSIARTDDEINSLVENDRHLAELARKWPTMTIAEKVAICTPGSGIFLVEGTADNFQWAAEVAEARESLQQRERASKPRATELRAGVKKEWHELAAEEVPERERTKAIADRLGEPLSTIDYHIRQMKLRTNKSTKTKT